MIFIFLIGLVLVLDGAATIYVVLTDDNFLQNEVLLGLILSFVRIIGGAYLFTFL